MGQNVLTAFKVSDYQLIGTRKTLNCVNSGRVSFDITGGVFPYYIETYLNTSLLRIDTFPTFQNSGTNVNLPDYKDYYNIESLPAGFFTFIIKDGNNYLLPEITETVKHVYQDFRCNGIAISPTANIHDYNVVQLNFEDINDDTDDLYKYYYDQRYRNISWWEYTYSYNGEPEKDWSNIPPAWNVNDTVTSASKYCDIWNNNYQIKVRVKECGTSECNTTRTVKYNDGLVISLSEIFDEITGCPTDSIKFTVHFKALEATGFFTTPVNCQITHSSSGEIWAQTTIDSREWLWEKVIPRSITGDVLFIEIIDDKNCPLIFGNYEISEPLSTHWNINAFGRVGNSPTDFDQIILECFSEKPPEGTKIELTESPNSNYYHYIATYNRTLNNWSITQDNTGFTVVPEADSKIVMRSYDLVSGNYHWVITDSCDRHDVIQKSFEFFKYEIEDSLTFEERMTCDKKVFLPKLKFVKIRKDGGAAIPLLVHFEVSGAPGGYFPSSGICNQDSITLTKPGNYQVSFKLSEGEDISCYLPPVTITYNYRDLSVTHAYGYVCNNETYLINKIVVIVDSSSGVAPYLFELYNQYGDYITSNTTGIFLDIGASGTIFNVMITDRCGTSYNQEITVTNPELGVEAATAENENVCQGNSIRLHAIDIAEYPLEYLWKGPNNYASLSKDPVINNATLLNKGYYYLYLTGWECAITDSVFINIIPPDTAYIVDTVCLGSRYIKYGFDLAPLCKPDTTYIFYQSGLQTLQYQCDSTVSLFLTVEECAALSIGSIDEICADDPFFVLPFNYKDDNFFYSIQFNTNAQEQGFINIDSGIVIHADYIEIPMPKGNDIQDYVMPHSHYSASIVVDNGGCKSDVLEFPFRISYPSWIIEQKWNDVIALLNDRYNGGYTFSKYEWFKNGVKLEGEYQSYIYILPTLEIGAEYRARLTRTLDGEVFFTCPFVPEYRPGMKVYPSFASQNEPIYIETQQDGNVFVWNLLGQKIAQHQIFKNQVNIINVNKTGFFVLEIVPTSGIKQTFKIIVQ